MITKTVNFTNFNGEDATKLLHFHVSKSTLMDNLDMRNKLNDLGQLLDGDPGARVGEQEIRQMIDMVKWFMSISYGVKSSDGMEFDQDDPAGSGPVWRSFKNSPAYDALLMSFFEQPESLVAFIIAVIPEDLRRGFESDNPEIQKALAEADKVNRPAPGSRIDEGGVVRTPEELRAGAPVAPEESAPKTPIPQSQYDLMKSNLNERQLEDFMSTRYIEG